MQSTSLTMNNEFIANRIKEARKARGFTQAQLAEYLNRTPSNVSDIERCRVQVNAEDLFFISQVLQKPIEYFYGQDIEDEDFEKIKITYLAQSSEGKKTAIAQLTLILSMQDFALKSERAIEDITDQELAEFVKNFTLFKGYINSMNEEANKSGKELMSLLEERNLTID